MNTETTQTIAKEVGAFSVMQWDHYGLAMIETEDGKEYAVALTEDEANEATAVNIRDMVWAFNTDFIIDHSSVLDYDDASRTIVNTIQALCEDGNDAITRLIDDMNDFIEDAINADGRGHFLSAYDGEEIELEGGIYLYRTN